MLSCSNKFNLGVEKIYFKNRDYFKKLNNFFYGFNSEVFIELTIEQLLDLGVHIGHNFKYSKFLSTWMIYGIKNKISIINVLMTVLRLRNALTILGTTIKGRRPIWILNTNLVLHSYTTRLARLVGEVGISTNRWLWGLLTNYDQIFPFLCLLKSYLISSYVLPRKYLRYVDILLLIKNTRLVSPGSIYIPDISRTLDIASEASDIHVPVVGILDTNTLGFDITNPIPGNDESYICMYFYSEVILRSILVEKIILIRNWRRNIRLNKREFILDQLVYISTILPKNFIFSFFLKSKMLLILFKLYIFSFSKYSKIFNTYLNKSHNSTLKASECKLSYYV